MKTLIVIVHPDLKNSLINKIWIEELSKYPEKYTLHDLHGAYPDENIDVEKEQQLVEAHGKIVFQFPFYWFNCTPFLKKWLDVVLLHGWAYGRNSGYKLAGRKIALAITAGINKEDYTASGRYRYTLEQLTASFELTFEYIKADYRSFFAFYGAEHGPDEAVVRQNALEYITFIDNM